MALKKKGMLSSHELYTPVVPFVTYWGWCKQRAIHDCIYVDLAVDLSAESAFLSLLHRALNTH